jgi:hypothetical protein
MTKSTDNPGADWEKIEKNLGRIAQMAGLLRLVIGAGVSVVASIVALAIWVNQTTKSVAATQSSLIALENKREQSLAEWLTWRRLKDETDIRLTVSSENLQKLLDRQQLLIDRLDQRDQRR